MLWRQFAGCLLCATAVACGGEGPLVGVIGSVPAVNGGVAADEPMAALAARDILSDGGSAADAAVAAFFVLSVTYPVGAGLAAGGLCMAFDAPTGEVKAIDFTPAAGSDGAPAGLNHAVPRAARSVTALHARYGRLRFEQLVQPAERLARFGFRVSRALAVQIAAHQDRLRQDPGTRRLFFGRDGGPLGEGATLVQPELAAFLAAMRTRGVAELYAGTLATRYAEGIAKLGGTLDREELRTYRPSWITAEVRAVGNDEVHLLQPGARPALAQAWDTLVERNAFTAFDGEGTTTAGPLSPVLARLYAAKPSEALAREIPRAEGGSSFVVVDRDGNMLACGFTMSRAFGAAREIPGTGILLTESAETGGAAPFAVMMAINKPTKSAQLAATVSQGVDGASALPLVAARTLVAKQSPAQALAEPRAVPAVGFGTILVDGDGDDLSSRLKAEGLAVERVASLGLVNLIRCPNGTRRGTVTCEYRSDPRGFGLGLGAE